MATHKRKHEVKLRQDTSVRTFTEDELKRVHYVYVQMASRIVSVCTANGILIMLSGGSALGAVERRVPRVGVHARLHAGEADLQDVHPVGRGVVEVLAY